MISATLCLFADWAIVGIFSLGSARLSMGFARCAACLHARTGSVGMAAVGQPLRVTTEGQHRGRTVHFFLFMFSALLLTFTRPAPARLRGARVVVLRLLHCVDRTALRLRAARCRAGGWLFPNKLLHCLRASCLLRLAHAF